MSSARRSRCLTESFRGGAAVTLATVGKEGIKKGRGKSQVSRGKSQVSRGKGALLGE